MYRNGLLLITIGLRGIAAIGFDPIARPSRNEGGRDHVTGNIVADQRALQLEAAGPGFVTTLEGALPAQALHETKNRRRIGRQRVQRRRPVPRQ